MRVLDEGKVRYHLNDLTFEVEYGELRLEIEVCQPLNLPINGIRLRRIEGDTWDYKNLCTNLLSRLKL